MMVRTPQVLCCWIKGEVSLHIRFGHKVTSFLFNWFPIISMEIKTTTMEIKTMENHSLPITSL